MDMVNFVTLRQEVVNGVSYSVWPGSPFDRGSADYYYGRAPNPNCFTAPGTMIHRDSMTPADIDAYFAGYSFQAELGDTKDWG